VSVPVATDTPARDLKTGDVVVIAGAVFVVELVARHITESERLHVVCRTVHGGVFIFDRGEDDLVEALRGDR